MKYKFIACDYDDTLLPKSGVISDFTKDTIQGYIARGGRFAICTGRMFRSIVKSRGNSVCTAKSSVIRAL